MPELTIEQMLAEAEAEAAARKALEDQRAARIAAIEAEQHCLENEAVIALLPEALRPYARNERPERFPICNSAVIEIPGFAPIYVPVSVESDKNWSDDFGNWIDYFKSAKISRDARGETVYRVNKWDADDGELYLRIVEDCPTLNAALLLASELGDTKPAAEAKAAKQREEASQPQPEVKKEPNVEHLCPVSARPLKGEMKISPCIGFKCAWWHNSMGRCAVFVIADNMPTL